MLTQPYQSVAERRLNWACLSAELAANRHRRWAPTRVSPCAGNCAHKTFKTVSSGFPSSANPWLEPKGDKASSCAGEDKYAPNFPSASVLLESRFDSRIRFTCSPSFWSLSVFSLGHIIFWRVSWYLVNSPRFNQNPGHFGHRVKINSLGKLGSLYWISTVRSRGHSSLGLLMSEGARKRSESKYSISWASPSFTLNSSKTSNQIPPQPSHWSIMTCWP